VAEAPTPQVFCVVTTDPGRVLAGGAPVFVAQDEEEQARIAMWLSRITNATVHDLHNGVFVLVVNLPGAGD
jgi:hypothetical protein